jgi:hypothetical protein
MRSRRKPEIIAGRVNADGSIAAGDGFTITKTGTGAYTLTLLGNFRMISVTVTPMTGTFHIAVLSAPAERTTNIAMFVSTTGAVADAQFVFAAVGIQV